MQLYYISFNNNCQYEISSKKLFSGTQKALLAWRELWKYLSPHLIRNFKTDKNDIVQCEFNKKYAQILLFYPVLSFPRELT